MTGLRIAHLSDPHFSIIARNPTQFFSKRWIGNFNLLLFRRSAYQTEHLSHLPELFNTLDVEAVCITGDFTSTSLKGEFLQAKKFVDSFSQPVYLLPGNHDCYTGGAQRSKRFYTYFPSPELKKQRIEKRSLGKKWWWVGLDCALATPPLCAFGRFFKAMEAPLEETLASIPEGDQVVLANHFPLFHSKSPSHDLSGKKRLQRILKRHPQVKLYLHGHDHAPYIIDNQNQGLPLVLNSGSAAHKPDGTFYLLDLHEKEVFVERLLFRKTGDEFTWVIDWQKRFDLDLR